MNFNDNNSGCGPQLFSIENEVEQGVGEINKYKDTVSPCSIRVMQYKDDSLISLFLTCQLQSDM